MEELIILREILEVMREIKNLTGSDDEPKIDKPFDHSGVLERIELQLIDINSHLDRLCTHLT